MSSAYSVLRRISLLGVCLCALLVGIPAAAEAPPECPTFFPDFGNCGRSGRWEGFEKPIVQPFIFEDPFITTGVYPFYVYHEFPTDSAFEGGDMHVAALQARIAITDRLAFIATKDGRAWFRPETPVVERNAGWFNIAAGLKYAFIADPERDFILSGVLTVEVPTGGQDLYQGWGQGVAIPSITFAKGFDRFHLIGDLGGEIPFNASRQSSSIFYHLYADYTVHRYFQPFVQFSGMHWVDGGNGQVPVNTIFGKLPLTTIQGVTGVGAFEGADVLNLGSENIDGTDLVTFAVGAHVPITKHVTLSAAYERAITDYRGIFDQRMTSSVTIEF